MSSQRGRFSIPDLLLAVLVLTTTALAAAESDDAPTAAALTREWFETLAAQPSACPPDIAILGDVREAACAKTPANFAEVRRKLERVEARHDRRLPWTLGWVRDGDWRRRWIVANGARLAWFDEQRGWLVVLPPRSCLDRQVLEREPPAPASAPMIAPKLEHSVRSDFPVAARRQRVSGAAFVQFLITSRGDVAAACILIAGPEGFGFESAALEAVRQWKYRPALVAGQPVATVRDAWVTWEIR